MKKIFLSLLLIATACSPLKAPDVELAPRIDIQQQVQALPFCLGVIGVNNCGAVTFSLDKAVGNEDWGYWSAGSSSLTYGPDPRSDPNGALNFEANFKFTLGWDLRVKINHAPVLATHGGVTAANSGLPTANAAIASMPDSSQGSIPKLISEVIGLTFEVDVRKGLSVPGTNPPVTLPEIDQSLILNQIGTGLISVYDPSTHNITLSKRIFILRCADGTRYFAIAFNYYARSEQIFGFDWRELK